MPRFTPISPAARLRFDQKGQLLRRPLRSGQLVGQELVAVVDCGDVTGRQAFGAGQAVMGTPIAEWEVFFIHPGREFQIEEATWFWVNDRLYKIDRSSPDTESDGAFVRLILQERRVVKQAE